MAVYVDKPFDYGYGPRYPILRFWSHMWADTLEELEEMAEAIGLKRSWFQVSKSGYQHYDITPGKRTLALEKGALQSEFLDWLRERRRNASA